MTRLQGDSVRFLFVLVSLLTATACATPRSFAPGGMESTSQAGSESFAGLSQESIDAIHDVEQEILQANDEIETPDPASSEASLKQHRPKIPLEINENVVKWIRYFTTQDRDRFQRFLTRGSAYKSLVQGILKDCGVPRELYYLAMIESGYVTHARSRAKAVGIWQFMRGTGIRYGLKQSSYVDERKDVVRATQAAAHYLRNLHTAFQSWYLAIASYNAGEGRILGAIMRGGSRDFWDLVENKSLPPETRNYVPKFLAAVIIGKHPEKYGFTDAEAPAFPEMKSVSVPGGVSLAAVANRAGVPLSTVKTLNPHLLRGITPRSAAEYAVWLPSEQLKDFERIQREVASLHGSREIRRAPRRKIASKSGKRVAMRRSTVRRTRIIHRVRAGEALSLIADRYHVPVRKIKRLNDLRTNRIYAGQRLLIPRGL